MKLTKNDAQEVLHKMCVLADSTDLQEDYGITQEQADALRDSVPGNGGEWEVPAWAAQVVKGEMEDHCTVLEGMAADARSDRRNGEALQLSKQAARLAGLFTVNGNPSPETAVAIDGMVKLARNPIGEVCEHGYPKAYWCKKCRPIAKAEGSK